MNYNVGKKRKLYRVNFLGNAVIASILYLAGIVIFFRISALAIFVLDWKVSNGEKILRKTRNDNKRTAWEHFLQG